MTTMTQDSENKDERDGGNKASDNVKETVIESNIEPKVDGAEPPPSKKKKTTSNLICAAATSDCCCFLLHSQHSCLNHCLNHLREDHLHPHAKDCC